MPTARGGLGAAALGGRCYVVGGEDWALPLPGTFATVEVFDAAQGRWSTNTRMQLARHGAGTAVFDGELWVLGGGPAQGNSYSDRVEIFTPR